MQGRSIRTPAPSLITDREAAARLGVSRRTLWALPGLPRVKLGPRSTRWDPRDLENYIEARRATPGPRA